MNILKKFCLTICFSIIIVATGFAQGIEVTVKDLKDSPKKYLGQTIITVGIVQTSPGKTFYEGEFNVVDQKGNSFPVNAWVATEVPPPPPGSKNQRNFPLMGDYVGKLLKLEGKVRLDEGRSAIKKKEYYFLNISTATEVK